MIVSVGPMTDTHSFVPGPDLRTKRPLPTPPPTLTIRPWRDALIDERGFDPRSTYVERFWLGILGPSATWLLRRLVRGLDEFPDGVTIDLQSTGRALGLGQGTSRHAALTRTLDRLCSFGMARRAGRDELQVRTTVPPLTRHQLDRLPLAIRTAHDAYMRTDTNDVGTQRARLTALAVLDAGANFVEAEAQLIAMRHPVPRAHDAVRWAASRIGTVND